MAKMMTARIITTTTVRTDARIAGVEDTTLWVVAISTCTIKNKDHNHGSDRPAAYSYLDSHPTAQNVHQAFKNIVLYLQPHPPPIDRARMK
jgi:hypothetical protein